MRRSVQMIVVCVSVGALGVWQLDPGMISSPVDGLYWACVTMTTVGYGDVSPQTPEGKLLAMILVPITLGIMGAVIGIVGGAFSDADFHDAGLEESEER